MVGWGAFAWSGLAILDRLRAMLEARAGSPFDALLASAAMIDAVFWLMALVLAAILLAIVEQLPKY